MKHALTFIDRAEALFDENQNPIFNGVFIKDSDLSYISLHEILHVLGLSHSGEYNGTYHYTMEEIDTTTRQFTVMSYGQPGFYTIPIPYIPEGGGPTQYFNPLSNPNVPGDYLSPVTPMIADYIALKENFGIDYINFGSTSYSFTQHLSLSIKYGPSYTVYDEDGLYDKVDFSIFSGNYTNVIDMRNGHASSVGGWKNNIYMGFNTEIEIIVGSDTNDHITGNNISETIDGKSGDDVVLGGGGRDVLLAGLGSDFLDGGSSNYIDIYGDIVDDIDVVDYRGNSVKDFDLYMAIGTNSSSVDYLGYTYTDTLVNVEHVILGDQEVFLSFFSSVYQHHIFTSGSGLGTIDFTAISAGFVGTWSATNLNLAYPAGGMGPLPTTFEGFDVWKAGSGANDTLVVSDPTATLLTRPQGTVFAFNAGSDAVNVTTSHGSLLVEGVERFVVPTLSAIAAPVPPSPLDPGVVPAGLAFEVVVDSDSDRRTLDFSAHAGRVLWRSGQAVESITSSGTTDWVYSGIQATFVQTPSSGRPVFSHIVGTQQADAFQGVVGQTLDAGGGNDNINIMGADAVAGGAGADLFRWIHTGVRTDPQTGVYVPGPQIVQDFTSEDTFVAGAMAAHQVTWADTADGALLTHTASGRQLLFSGQTVAALLPRTIFENGGLWIGSTMSEAQSFSSSSSPWVMHALDGHDTLHGGTGADKIYAGSGNDVVYGNNGNDTLEGGSGNDTINGGGGADVIYGGDGHDHLAHGEGSYGDNVYGGNGSDFFHGNGNITLGAWFSNLYGGEGRDVFYIPKVNASNWFGGRDQPHHRIADFTAGEDLLLLVPDSVSQASNGFNRYGQSVVQVGADVRIGDNDSRLVLNTTVADVLDALIWVTNDSQALGYWAEVRDSGALTRNGTSGANALVGNNGADILYGFDGNDTITGNGGHDDIHTGGGNDVAYGGAGNDRVYAYAGFDTVYGGAGNDWVDALTTTKTDRVHAYGEDGDDTLLGALGSDSLFGGIGNDRIEGAAGGDYIYGGDGNDLLNGQDGYDYVYGEAGNDTVMGGADNDQLFGGAGADHLMGGDRFDKLTGGAGADTLDGGVGVDGRMDADGYMSVDTAVYEASLGAVSVDLSLGTASGGDAEGDVLISIEGVVGSAFSDHLVGDAGSNTLTGNDGDDTLEGAAGIDRLEGGAGNDVMDGGSDDDQMYGGAGNDVVWGGDGDDFLEGGAGSDVLNGGAGLDIVFYRGFASGVVVSLDGTPATGGDAEGDLLVNIEGVSGTELGDWLSGNDLSNEMYGNSGNDSLLGGAGGDFLYGGDGDDVCWGGDGDDVLYAYYGNDTLLGGTGNDTLQGEEGENTLEGGSGDDVLRGSYPIEEDPYGYYAVPGIDTFVFDATSGNDVVFDFCAPEGDRLLFKAGAFAVGTTAEDVLASYVTVSATATLIAWNGNSVTLEGVVDLTAADVILL